MTLREKQTLLFTLLDIKEELHNIERRITNSINTLEEDPKLTELLKKEGYITP